MKSGLSCSKGRIKAYNTLGRRLEDFVPIEDGRVGIYVCGVTVYDEFHLGHARSAVVFDMIRRAKEEGITISDLAERYIASYFDSMSCFNIKPANFYPRATEHIDDMLSLIGRLGEKGLVYRTRTGVYYRVSGFREYGKLSGRSRDEMMAGARVEPNEEKEDPLDFALWKAAKEGGTVLGQPMGSGKARMAYRVFGDGYEISRRELRYTRGRGRSDIPTSRERDSAVRRGDWETLCEILDP